LALNNEFWSAHMQSGTRIAGDNLEITVARGAAAAAESAISAVSWAAIIGGALVALAATTILMSLGAGLGFTALSPWPNAGRSAATFGIAAVAWIVLAQWIAAALGGYITGRLRKIGRAHV
jgi:hypothetical protein